MFNFANAQIMGNVGRVDIKNHGESRYARFSVAINDRYKKDGEWIGVTHWIDVVSFKPATVDYVERNIVKGRLAHVTGTLKSRTWEKDGRTYSAVSLHADAIQVGRKSKDNTET